MFSNIHTSLFFLYMYVYNVQKFGVSKNIFLRNYKKIQQECIKLIKRDSKDICNVTKDFYFKENSVLLNFLFKES